jgi:hypothetical protein
LNKKQSPQSNRADSRIEEDMKTIVTTLTALAIFGVSQQRATAGDREWATAGKVLTGVFAGAALARAFEPVPVYHTTTYYSAPVGYVPAPAPIVVSRPVVVQAAPVAYSAPVVYSTPMYVQPAPVYVVPAYVASAPVVRFHVGFGHGHHHYHHHRPVHRICR